MARTTPRNGAATDGAAKQLEQIVDRARELKASDVHIEPKEKETRVRLRVDGVLVPLEPLSVEAGNTLVSRVKVLAKLDITAKRQPQDGTLELPGPDGRPTSLRVSTFPAVHGEKLVLRVLRSSAVIPLAELGMSERQLRDAKRFCASSGGLVLVTGPTGSGKTSTLYSMLGAVDTDERNVVTLEDPIEAVIPDITQGQVNPRGGFSFADGLRSILRQDPDVILVGEMRDIETTEIAIEASLTGHMVLSTMHTNSAIATITRLLDIGIEPHIVAHALSGVIAQRLLRRVCSCAQRVKLDRDVEHESGICVPKGSVVPIAKGCHKCLDTGYRGRCGAYEVAALDDELRDLIKNRADITSIKQSLADKGIESMRRHAVSLATSGVTTLGEVVRLT